MSETYRTVLVTGASSGMGIALAETFSAPGQRLVLVARNRERLDATAQACRARGAEVVAHALDIRDAEALATMIAAEDAKSPFDLVIANAGVTSGLSPGLPREAMASSRAVMEANVFGMLNTIVPAMDAMCVRGRGRIAVVGSVAALRGLPYSPSYCASKAAVHAYCEALRPNLKTRGVGLTLIVPGFVETPMSGSLNSPRPLLVEAPQAAAIIRRGLERGQDRIIFPRLLYWASWLATLVPSRLYDAIAGRVPVTVPEYKEQ